MKRFFEGMFICSGFLLSLHIIVEKPAGSLFMTMVMAGIAWIAFELKSKNG